MVYIANWGDAVTSAILNVGYGVLNFIPKLFIALVIFAIGWVLAVLIERLVESVFKALKVDSLLKSAGLEEVVKRSGYNLNSGLFVGSLVKWYVIVVFLIASFDLLDLDRVNSFLTDVLNYLPQVIVAVLILMVAVIVANAMHRIVVASARAGHVRSAELLGRITKWSILIFALLVALTNLGVAPRLIEIVVMAVFAGAALALGLAFGLGGKNVAEKLIERTANNIIERE
jgi:hypothetical protein